MTPHDVEHRADRPTDAELTSAAADILLDQRGQIVAQSTPVNPCTGPPDGDQRGRQPISVTAIQREHDPTHLRTHAVVQLAHAPECDNSHPPLALDEQVTAMKLPAE